jgi:hypothetical protein
MFKWNQGMVHGNTVISHFGEGIDRKCTFCKIDEVQRLTMELGRELTELELQGLNVVDESRLHIFWECDTVKSAIRTCYNGVWGTAGEVDKESFLMGKLIYCAEATQLYMLVNMYIKYKIWLYKLASVKPRMQSITDDIHKLMENICKYRKWKNMLPLIKRQLQAQG